MYRKRMIAILALFVCALTLVQASYVFKEEKIEREYNTGDSIRGAITIVNVSGELAEQLLETNFAGSISFLNLIKAAGYVEGTDYNCSTKQCAANYAVKKDVSSMQLHERDKKLIGFKITDKDVMVDYLKFTIESDAAPSCNRQFVLRPLVRENYSLMNTRYLPTSCNARYLDCFDDAVPKEYVTLQTVPYCQRIELPPSPAVQVGSRVKNGTATRTLKMSLYDSQKRFLAECSLPQMRLSQEDLTCILNYSHAFTDQFWICISADEEGGEYMISSENDEPVCGTFGLDNEEFTGDYYIFARSMQFDRVHLDVNQTTFESFFPEMSFQEYVQSYVESVYAKDCSQGCIIPFEIEAETEQNLIISNPKLAYTSKRGGIVSTTVYELEEKPVKINSPSLTLDLALANFTIPLTSNLKTLRLLLGGKEMFPPINLTIVKSFGFDIYPKEVLVASETRFRISSGEQIIKSTWKFGDNPPVSVNNAAASFTFASEGAFTVEVTAFTTNGSSKKKFLVIAGNAKEAASILLKSLENDSLKIGAQINALPSWIKTEVEKDINLTGKKLELENIKKEVQNNPSANYSQLVARLITLDIPVSLDNKKSWDITLEAAAQDIDLGYIEKISNMTAIKKDETIIKILDWMGSSFDTKIQGKNYYLSSKSTGTPFFTWISIDLAPKTNNFSEAYLILNYPRESFIFAQDYHARDVSPDLTAATAIPLTKSAQHIEFIIKQDMDPADFRAYASPLLSSLIEKDTDIGPRDDKNPKTKTAKTLYWILAAVAVLLYIILQEWYKRHYESHLFPSKDDLYNVLTFIYNSRLSGLDDSTIAKKLEDSGWAIEQVRFVFRKIDGRRTGMWEIPIFKVFEKRSVDKEIAKRRQSFTGRKVY